MQKRSTSPNQGSWKSHSSKIVYENNWGRRIREHEVTRPNGRQGIYSVMEIPPGVVILAVTAKKEIYLIEQYRFPIAQNSIELPSGGIDDLAEDPLIAAQRELKEETGIEAKKWTRLGELCFSTGSSNERSTVYLAEDLTETNEHEQEQEGIVKLHKIKLPDLLAMIKKGEIVDASSIASLLLAADYLNIGFKAHK